jgi:hypothetical protein
MLSEHEQSVWDEIERHYRSRPDRGRGDVPAPVIGGLWGAVLLVLLGVPAAGLAVGAATGLIWLLWRLLPRLGGADAAGATGDVDDRVERSAMP